MQRFASAGSAIFVTLVLAGCGATPADKIFQENKRLLEDMVQVTEAMGKTNDLAEQKQLIAKMAPLQNKAMEIMVRIEALPPDQRDALKQRIAKELQPLADKLSGKR